MVNEKNIPSEWLIDDDFTNQRVDYFLKKKNPSLSFPNICKMLRKGVVKVNSKRVKNSYILKEKDLVVSRLNISTPNIKKKVSLRHKSFFDNLVIFKNEDYYIINKPSGLAVQGGTKVKINLDKILESLESNSENRPKLVHRLDKQTSGILIISRNLKTTNFFGDLFKKRKIEKIYITIIHGVPKKKKGKINIPLTYNEKIYESETDYYVVESQNNHSIVLVKLLTGRKHQIRKHFFEIGHPILGDNKYNKKTSKLSKEDKLFLHSYSVKFEDTKGNQKFFDCDLPNYFKKRIKLLDFKKNLTTKELNLKNGL
ncbi:MAG: RluA family pseudouridine synthase [Alphaproteobacteria bacterium]